MAGVSKKEFDELKADVVKVKGDTEYIRGYIEGQENKSRFDIQKLGLIGAWIALIYNFFK
jgi:hypothetical protein